ncbi:MAG TPA: AMP-binding protein, partial [Candidatus Xenobia bacterium]
GAEPVVADVMRSFSRRFSGWGWREDALMPVYGLSEATLAVTMAERGRPYRTCWVERDALHHGQATPGSDLELVSLGRPLPTVQVTVRAKDGQELAEREVGHVWIRGPSVTRGYVDRVDHPLQDGWFDTGDKGFLHEDELYLTGRDRDVIVVRGANYDPHELEKAAWSVPGSRPGCAAAVSHLTPQGERVLVFVEFRRASPDLPTRCAQAIRAAVGIEPDEVIAVAPGTLPRTSSGKIRRGEALRRWLEGHLERPAQVTRLAMARELVLNAVARWKR